jgi:hypothetical protein
VRHTHVEQVAEVLVLNFQEAVLKIEAEHVFGCVRVALRFAVHIIEASDDIDWLVGVSFLRFVENGVNVPP